MSAGVLPVVGSLWTPGRLSRSKPPPAGPPIGPARLHSPRGSTYGVRRRKTEYAETEEASFLDAAQPGFWGDEDTCRERPSLVVGSRKRCL